MPRSRTSRVTLLVVLAGLLAAAAIPAAASAAAQRYAGPTGSGSACSSASPCSIKQAVEGASSGDEVIVTPGDYQLTATVATSVPVTIHGVAGKPRPRLLFSGVGQEGLRVDSGSILRFVEVDQAPGTDARALFASESVLVDQVIARASGAGDTAMIQSSTIRNSIVVASGNSGLALTTANSGAVSASTYRNVTAIASGANGIAIQVRAGFAGGSATVDLVNVIARGHVGLEARTDSSGAQATINVFRTNYIAPVKAGTNATIADFGGNQTSAPMFANWQVGDYRQAPGSATINAGYGEAANGTLDVEGDPRNLGVVDIGADERVPAPAAATGAAGAITDHSATMSGSVDGHGGPTTYHFEYGPTTAYGSSTPTSDAGTSTAAASASLSGLEPATTYHYRLVAANSGGVGTGADQTFSTAAPAPASPATASTPTPPPPPPTASPSTTPTPPPAFAGVRLASTRLSFARLRITMTLECPAATAGRCTGRTNLTALQRRTSSRPAARIILGRAPFSIAAGKRAKVTVRVSRPGRRLLGRTPRLAGKATIAAHDGAGQTRSTAAKVTIRRRHR